MTEIPVIETARLRLRAATEDDFPALADMWGDERTVRFIGGAVRLPADVWLRLLAGAGMWHILGYGYWLIEHEGRLAGQGGFADFHRPSEPPLSAPEAGWAFAPDAWGRGFATEALAAMLSWADANLSVPMTCCIIDRENGASARVAEKCGYRFERMIELAGPTRLFTRARR